MIFTLDNVINSLAGVLTAQYPDYPVYASPNQQGTDYPCFFIFFMPSKIEKHMNDRFLRDLGVDVVFVQQRNIVNGNAEIQAIAEYLDGALDLFDYVDGRGWKAKIHTFERQWQTEDDEMHYQFHIRQRVSIPRNNELMQIMEENNASIKEN